jgi:GPI mannosyltransferase 1 subunit M
VDNTGVSPRCKNKEYQLELFFSVLWHGFLTVWPSIAGSVLQAAFWYGLIVHFRIYPIIYAIPFVVVLSKSYADPSGRPTLTQWSSEQHLRTVKASQREPTSFLATLCDFLLSFMTRNTILFGLLSRSMFFAWTGVFFYLYGWDFLNETLLYHLTRTDPRHNFSIYFYHIYLHHQQRFSSIQRLASFLPQVIVQLSLILHFSRLLHLLLLTR